MKMIIRKIIFSLLFLASSCSLADTNYQSTPLGYFISPDDPTSSDTLVNTIVGVFNDSGVLPALQTYSWWNQTTNSYWRSVDLTSDSLVWKKLLNDGDINIGNINQPRSWQTVSLAVDTARTPSVTKDVNVKVKANLSSTDAVGAVINLQIRTSTSPDVWTTYDTQGLSGLLTTTPSTANLLVPANSTYRITTSGTVNNISVFELSN